MKKPVLVIMAAGMGSRYGGLKQIDPIDEYGNIIMDFSIYDARRAGFEKVVFIIKKENEELFREAVGDRIAEQMEVAYVFQELSDLPDGFSVPEGREKPWGTGLAILSCRNAVDGPFAVINADDYYGPEAFRVIYDYLMSHEDDRLYRIAMVGYQVENTLTDMGSVEGGVCETDAEGHALYNNYLNPDSLITAEHAKAEPSLKNAGVGDRFQFVRTGYFCKDSKYENTFNRIVSLKDSFKA